MPIETVYVAAVAACLTLLVTFWPRTRRPTYPRKISEHIQEVAPGQYVLNAPVIASRWAPPGMKAVAWCNGQPCKFRPLSEEEKQLASSAPEGTG
jgi:hypothetical protein